MRTNIFVYPWKLNVLYNGFNPYLQIYTFNLQKDCSISVFLVHILLATPRTLTHEHKPLHSEC